MNNRATDCIDTISVIPSDIYNITKGSVANINYIKTEFTINIDDKDLLAFILVPNTFIDSIDTTTKHNYLIYKIDITAWLEQRRVLKKI